MDHKDKNFFIALAYTLINGKELDLLAFREKVKENYAALSDHDSKNPGKAHV